MDAPPKTLPASWYTSSPLYQLERRAVFLKAWYLVGPIVKFKPEEPVDYEFSGISVTVRRNTESDTISASTSTGQPLRTHTTPTGLCFTTISPLAPAFSTYFPGLERTLSAVDFTSRPYRRSLKYPGNFNWKTMVDGYQECLHCSYTHPSFSALYPPHSYAVVNHENWSQHFADPAKPSDGLFLYFFPNCTLNVYGGGMTSFRVCPLDAPGQTRMEFDYFNLDEGEKFEAYYRFVRQVAIEDFELCEVAQGNLERGVYAEGVLNPGKETGVVYYQQRVLELCLAQRQKERREEEKVEDQKTGLESCRHELETAKMDFQTLPIKDVMAPAISAIVLAIAVYLVATYGTLWISQARQRIFTAANVLRQPTKSREQIIPKPAEVTQASDFPSDWWTSPHQFNLETRAILSKTWLHLAHTTTLPKPGSYRTYTIASHSLLLIRGRDGVLRAFHNICRHRAYTVATKSEGCSQVLMCRYHGWTYDSTGKLVRAPKFEDVPGFDRGANGLFEVRTYVDSSGFVYVNLDVYGSDGLTIRVGVPIRAKLRLLESWSAEGAFNWKIAVPQGSFRIGSMAMRSKFPDLVMLIVKGRLESWRWAAEFELSPLTHLIRSAKGDLWLTISIVPKTHAVSSIACALYTSSDTGETVHLSIDAIKAEVQSSIMGLAETFERIKDDGETAAEYAQEPLLAECKAHLRLERFMGKEIHPASRLRESSRECKVADDLCHELEIEAAGKAESARPSSTTDALAW